VPRTTPKRGSPGLQARYPFNGRADPDLDPELLSGEYGTAR